MDVSSDEAVMLEVREGRIGSIAMLFERHHRALFQFFYRLTARREHSEDLTQEVFLRMLKYRASYEPRSSFAAWMYQMARNVHRDAQEKRRREAPAWGEGQGEPESREAPAHESLQREQEAELVRRALAALPEEKREVLVLSRYQGLKYEQIGEILGCEAGAVKVRVYRALRSLSRAFAELAGEPR